jgi:hypothetical protein
MRTFGGLALRASKSRAGFASSGARDADVRARRQGSLAEYAVYDVVVEREEG